MDKQLHVTEAEHEPLDQFHRPVRRRTSPKGFWEKMQEWINIKLQ